ncbi:transglutaminase-like domain-containing protein [Variovorax terrae]|uniref:Transglutaminase-like domain-containing protein n=1 Tax=Variovorax terrae TaxID=2923278 RepID=A0A9X2ALH6_9BURK|nr:transglutaminase-like domain-containing protein [Variovorax terrae]MCJ0762319.1 transglutaminase-like domain-containing protein [Variovorax terrae]
MTTQASGLLRVDLEPGHWLGATPTLNLADDRLRLRAKALTQLAQNDHQRALSICDFVRTLPYAASGRLRCPTARQVLDAGRGDCWAKSTLFIALLRLAGVPARLRMVQLRGELLRGHVSWLKQVNHSLVEVWLGGRWVRTDTHVFDLRYLVAARSRLTAQQWEQGYGIHRRAQSLWNGHQDAFACLALDDDSGMPLADLGVYHDPQEFAAALMPRREPRGAWASLRRRFTLLAMERRIRRLRAEDANTVAPQELPSGPRGRRVA